MLWMRQELVGEHGGKVFERHRYGQPAMLGPLVNQADQFLDSRIDRTHVVAGLRGRTIECEVFAGVIDLLPDKGANFRVEIRWGALAESLHRIDEQGFASRECGG